jgi:hypothetical protein
MYVKSPVYLIMSTDNLDEVAQTNNALIYPALGLGAILARSRTISPSMLMAGVHALASLSPALHNPEASLLPDLADVRKVSVEVAAAVVRQAVEDGNATDQETIDVVQGKGELGLEAYIKVSNLVFFVEVANETEPYVGCRLPTTTVGRLDVLGIRLDLDIYWHVSLVILICGPTAYSYKCRITKELYSSKIPFPPLVYFIFISNNFFIYRLAILIWSLSMTVTAITPSSHFTVHPSTIA